jgi:hypothetical protein
MDSLLDARDTAPDGADTYVETCKECQLSACKASTDACTAPACQKGIDCYYACPSVSDGDSAALTPCACKKQCYLDITDAQFQNLWFCLKYQCNTPCYSGCMPPD